MCDLYDFSSDILDKCTIKTPKWSFSGHTVRAKCVKVYDGDSATFVFVPPGLSEPYRFACRFLGYNSAELRTKNKKEKEEAIKSRDYLSNLILDKIVQLELGPFDKYGRVLVHVYAGEKHINAEMLRLGYGAPYDGTGPKLY